jgi:CubicO group peptidase (beta-lactamase class C family)
MLSGGRLLKALALLSAIAVPGAEAADVAREIRAAIDEEIALGFSGAVLVARGGEVEVEGVYGSMGGMALPPGGRFLLASAAKQFTSAAVLKLADLGRLRLDDPVANHLPGVPGDKRAITIRQLLSHTSGLPQGYGSESATGWQDAARTILALPLAAAPGERFIYSNENYQLAVAVVEAVSGERYAEFVRDRLFAPAGLHDIGQLGGAQGVAALSPMAAPLPPRLRELRWGGFGYYATARDFFAWYEALRTGAVLERESVTQLFAPLVKIGEGQAALGWFVGATPGGEPFVFTRGNDDIGASSVLYAYPRSGVVIVVLSHAGQKTEERSWARAVHARIEEILFARPAVDAPLAGRPPGG